MDQSCILPQNQPIKSMSLGWHLHTLCHHKLCFFGLIRCMFRFLPDFQLFCYYKYTEMKKNGHVINIARVWWIYSILSLRPARDGGLGAQICFPFFPFALSFAYYAKKKKPNTPDESSHLICPLWQSHHNWCQSVHMLTPYGNSLSTALSLSLQQSLSKFCLSVDIVERASCSTAQKYPWISRHHP